MDFFEGVLLDGCDCGNPFYLFKADSRKMALFAASIAKSIFSCAIWASIAVASATARTTHNFVCTLGRFKIILKILPSLGFLGIFAPSFTNFVYLRMLGAFIFNTVNMKRATRRFRVYQFGCFFSGFNCSCC